MKECYGCGFSMDDDALKCPMCGTLPAQSKGIPVSYSNPTGSDAPAAGSVVLGVGMDDLIAQYTAQPTCLLFNAARQNNTLQVIGVKAGAPADIRIPETHNGLIVTEIADSAFANQNIVSVHIPPTVKIIGKEAFANCRMLSSVTGCQALVYIGSRAFSGCIHLTQCQFPSRPLAARSSFAGCFDGGMALEANVTFDEEAE